MEKLGPVIVMAAILLAFGSGIVWLFSSDWFNRAFDWTLDHPVLTGLTFCLLIASMIVLGA